MPRKLISHIIDKYSVSNLPTESIQKSSDEVRMETDIGSGEWRFWKAAGIESKFNQVEDGPAVITTLPDDSPKEKGCNSNNTPCEISSIFSGQYYSQTLFSYIEEEYTNNAGYRNLSQAPTGIIGLFITI
jgi:hypothetical protein